MNKRDIEEGFAKLEADFVDQNPKKFETNSIFGNRNTWICKPAASCCGKRITIMSKKTQILKYIWEEENCVIQKYIERPFLIQNRKFDLRQWFLVTSWTPLEVWIYDEFYCRFSKQDYDLNDFSKYIHLTNQAIQRSLNHSQYQNQYIHVQ